MEPLDCVSEWTSAALTLITQRTFLALRALAGETVTGTDASRSIGAWIAGARIDQRLAQFAYQRHVTKLSRCFSKLFFNFFLYGNDLNLPVNPGLQVQVKLYPDLQVQVALLAQGVFQHGFSPHCVMPLILTMVDPVDLLCDDFPGEEGTTGPKMSMELLRLLSSGKWRP